MDLDTIFLYLIGVERIEESQELQSTTHLGKEVQDSKGANTCPFIFLEYSCFFLLFIQSSISFFIKTILLGVIFTFFGKSPSLTKRLIVDIEIPKHSETSWIEKRDYFLYSCVGDLNLKRK